MNYQQILSFNYVFNLINERNKVHYSNHSNHIEVVKLEDKFYMKDINKNLYLIQNIVSIDDINIKSKKNHHLYDINSYLDTCIYFEKYKTKPMEGFIELNKHIYKTINIELLKFLYFQYSIDKSYFEN